MPRFDKLLVLDIDETLLYSSLEPLGREPDFVVDPYFVYKRPGVDNFLETCLDWFEVGYGLLPPPTRQVKLSKI